jgi:hypothetical protein
MQGGRKRDELRDRDEWKIKRLEGRSISQQLDIPDCRIRSRLLRCATRPALNTSASVSPWGKPAYQAANTASEDRTKDFIINIPPKGNPSRAQGGFPRRGLSPFLSLGEAGEGARGPQENAAQNSGESAQPPRVPPWGEAGGERGGSRNSRGEC